MFSVNEKRNITFTSRDYATLKTASVIAKTGKRQTIETREKRIKALTGQKRTPEQRKNMSDGQIGLKKPQQHGKNVSKALTGVKHTKDRIERTRLSRIGLKRELITCPHCGYTGGNVGMTRYHFNECKYHSNKIHTLLTKYDSASLAAELFKIRSILIFQQMSSILN